MVRMEKAMKKTINQARESNVPGKRKLLLGASFFLALLDVPILTAEALVMERNMYFRKLYTDPNLDAWLLGVKDDVIRMESGDWTDIHEYGKAYPVYIDPNALQKGTYWVTPQLTRDMHPKECLRRAKKMFWAIDHDQYDEVTYDRFSKEDQRKQLQYRNSSGLGLELKRMDQNIAWDSANAEVDIVNCLLSKTVRIQHNPEPVNAFTLALEKGIIPKRVQPLALAYAWGIWLYRYREEVRQVNQIIKVGFVDLLHGLTLVGEIAGKVADHVTGTQFLGQKVWSNVASLATTVVSKLTGNAKGRLEEVVYSIATRIERRKMWKGRHLKAQVQKPSAMTKAVQYFTDKGKEYVNKKIFKRTRALWQVLCTGGRKLTGQDEEKRLKVVMALLDKSERWTAAHMPTAAQMPQGPGKDLKGVAFPKWLMSEKTLKKLIKVQEKMKMKEKNNRMKQYFESVRKEADKQKRKAEEKSRGEKQREEEKMVKKWQNEAYFEKLSSQNQAFLSHFPAFP